MSLSEALSRSATEGKTIECPRGGAHSAGCICKGTRLVKACENCQGAGFDGAKNEICRKCSGLGALAVMVDTTKATEEFKVS